MKFKVDEETCVGCGVCETECPAVFEMEGDKAKVILDPVPEEDQAAALSAEDACPVQAISHS